MSSGKCPVCGFRVRLRKSGKIGAHRIYIGSEVSHYCSGAGQAPRREGET